ncbi:hypothetical protein ABZY90_32390, partial [Streptomyces sp. NPDC006422]|uniref:hypothetical protein n=1 Tax=Streptomyces sp. NPDC006422 TaxID=3155457 RepID=UPI0033B682E2
MGSLLGERGAGREAMRAVVREGRPAAPGGALPEIHSSAEVYGEVTGGKLGDLIGGIPVASA